MARFSSHTVNTSQAGRWMVAWLVCVVSLLSDPTWAATPMVSAGGYHSCALLSSGAVQCWGGNNYGQLGNGTTTDSATPVTVIGISNATSVSAGRSHSCAVLSTGTVQCWGDNYYGLLGNGSTTSSSSPVAVSGISNATSVSAGAYHSCAVLISGAVQCWGSNNFYGQLGNGSTIGSSTTSSSPVAVSGISNATSVSVGQYHSCAVLSTGTVQCWGSNGYGQLGNDGNHSSIPVAVSEISNATSVSAGEHHSCAVLSGGAVQCWGDNGYGQLGNGSTSNFSSPPVAVIGINTATSVSAGVSHSCAVLSTGTVQCWGYNLFGQLGNGNTTNSTSPVTVSGISNAISVSAGGYPPSASSFTGYLEGKYHTCAVLSSGVVQCWGSNDTGQLGNGFTISLYNTSPVAVTGIGNASSVSAGSSHSCAVLSSGAVQCWGNNYSGQLGNGSTTYSNSLPVAVIGISTATSVSAGSSHTCAVLSSGAVQCWGFNYYGQLGNGSTTSSSTPVTVNGISSAISVSVGFYHSCAVLSSGAVQCWGSNGGGQLGNGSTADSSSPVTVSGISTATSVSVGFDHSCAVLSGGAVQCWGFNRDGQLGNGSTTSSSTPVTVNGIGSVISVSARESYTCAVLSSGAVQCWGRSSGLLVDGVVSNATSVSAGAYHSCAVLSSGTVQCWGANPSGQLGNGTRSNDNDYSPSPPVTVSGINNASSVSAGYVHSCAVLSSGAVQCWGSDASGQGGAPRPYYYPGAVVGANGQGALNLNDTAAALLAVNIDKVFDWAERNYAQFSPTGTASGTILGYRYRVYGGRYYLAVNQGATPPHLYYFDDQSMTMLLDVGLLSVFLALVAK